MNHLQQRRAFGLNFERHTPEAVELYGRPVRVGDKVHILPPRGQTTSSPDKRLWIVTGGGSVDGVKRAELRDPKTGDVTHPPAGRPRPRGCGAAHSAERLTPKEAGHL